MSMYPMTMEFGTEENGPVSIVVNRDGFQWADHESQRRFQTCPAAERLSLRRQFLGQVALAKGTPEK